MHDVKNILVCPLEWGLGHAGRMIPVAARLMERGHRVFAGAGAEYHDFFKSELPEIKLVNFPGFRLTYSSWIPQYLIILLKAPSFIYHSVREHWKLKEIIRRYDIDIVISDSRPGLWNRNIRTVFVTHMLLLPHPWRLTIPERMLIPVIRLLTRKFSFLFIPDLPGDINFSGKLSHGIRLPENARYTGILSRFAKWKEIRQEAARKKYCCTVILSGPEPQKSIFREKMVKILLHNGRESAILEGSPDRPSGQYKLDNITFFSHLPSREMAALIEESGNIVTRPGYTTIMELASLGRSALVIPTPGQTEQEYLADYLSGRGWFRTLQQKSLVPGIDLQGMKSSIPEWIAEESEKMLSAALDELLEEQQHQSEDKKS